MAGNYLDSLMSGANSLDDIRSAYYEKYKDRFVDSTENLVNSETFLNLLVAEMTNQDPLEPTSNTEFITQMASFSQLSYMRDSSTYAMANYAASLVGKIATATKTEGKNMITKTGVVTSVTKVGNSYNVMIDGQSFDIKRVTKVEDPGNSGTVTDPTLGSNALADSIARASGMIGMYATVKTDDGVSVGWIDTVKVKNGVITVVLGDEYGNIIGEFDLADITEVTYATIGFDPGTGDTEGSDNVEDGEDGSSVDGTGGIDGDDSDVDGGDVDEDDVPALDETDGTETE